MDVHRLAADLLHQVRQQRKGGDDVQLLTVCLPLRREGGGAEHQGATQQESQQRGQGLVTQRAGDQALAWSEEESQQEQCAGGQHDRHAGGHIVGIAQEQPHHGAGRRDRHREPDHHTEPVRQQVRRRRRGDQQGNHQDHAHCLQGNDRHQGEHHHQTVVDRPHWHASRSGHYGVEGAEFEFLIEGQREKQHGSSDADREVAVGVLNGQDVAEEDLREVRRRLRFRHEQHADREKGGKDDADRRIVSHR